MLTEQYSSAYKIAVRHAHWTLVKSIHAVSFTLVSPFQDSHPPCALSSPEIRLASSVLLLIRGIVSYDNNWEPEAHTYDRHAIILDGKLSVPSERLWYRLIRLSRAACWVIIRRLLVTLWANVGGVEEISQSPPQNTDGWRKQVQVWRFGLFGNCSMHVVAVPRT